MKNIMTSNLAVSFTFSYKDLLLKKLYSAVICSVFSQILILHLCLIIINTNLLNPISWVSTSFQTVTSFSTWLYIVPHISIIFAQCIICAKDYVTDSTYASTRFQKIMKVYSVHNLILLNLYIIIGIIHVWLILSLAFDDYRSLVNSKTDGSLKSEIVEETFFLLLGGLWTGFYFFAKVYISNKHIMFPVIHQSKLTRFKADVVPILQSSFSKSLLPSFYFILFYYFWGGDLKSQFSHTFGLTYKDYYSVWVYFYHWIFASLYFFNMNLIKLFFKLFLSEPVEFPLIKQDNVLTIQESLTLDKLPVVQSLASLDLHLLSQWSPMRRRILFTLSQPGEHPHNWNCLVKSVLKLYNSYIEILDKATQSILVNEKSTRQIIENTESMQPNFEDKFHNLRNMTYRYLDEPKIVNISSNLNVNQPKEVPSEFQIKIRNKIKSIIHVIRTVLGINYLFDEIPHANIERCLGNGHLLIWTSQGISELILASLKEDQFGVVQKDIPVILTTMVNLKQRFDKLNKLPAVSKKLDENYKVKNAVLAALKRSLFNISHNFQMYFPEFPLSRDVVSYLNTHILLSKT